MSRMSFVREELESVLNANIIEDMLDRLRYHAENYFIRAYELRERAAFLIAGLCGDEKLADLLKGDRRGEALGKISSILPALIEPMDRLLKALDGDIKLRNLSTHEQFLSFGLWIEGTILDPQDVLLHYGDTPDELAKIESRLREEAELFVEEHVQKCSDVIEA